MRDAKIIDTSAKIVDGKVIVTMRNHIRNTNEILDSKIEIPFALDKATNLCQITATFEALLDICNLINNNSARQYQNS